MTTWAWEGQEVAVEKEVAVLEAVATETSGSEEGGEDECALSMTKKRDCQGVKEIANSRGVRGLCLTDASRISAVWGSTFRDLSIGTLHSCA